MSIVDTVDYAIDKILGIYCSRCERVTTPYVSDRNDYPCCNGCWQLYPEEDK